jgi:hypothetical protein
MSDNPYPQSRRAESRPSHDLSLHEAGSLTDRGTAALVR